MNARRSEVRGQSSCSGIESRRAHLRRATWLTAVGRQVLTDGARTRCLHANTTERHEGEAGLWCSTGARSSCQSAHDRPAGRQLVSGLASRARNQSWNPSFIAEQPSDCSWPAPSGRERQLRGCETRCACASPSVSPGEVRTAAMGRYHQLARRGSSRRSAKPPSSNRRSAVPRIAAARASFGGQAEHRLGGAHREYACRWRPAPDAAERTRDRPVNLIKPFDPES